MTVNHLEFLVEEPSMEAALRELLPRLVGELTFDIYTYQGKRDLLAKLPYRLHGYRRLNWKGVRVVVIVDRDSDDCRELKRHLEEISDAAGLRTRSKGKGGDWTVLNRIAIEELEAWYFGDWNAVRRAFPGVSENVPRSAGYRDPDAIAGGTWEALERELKRAGHMKAGLAKVEAAQRIAAYMDPDANQSRSFCVFRDAIRELAA